MTFKQRRCIFYFFIAVFILITPIILLYAQGYNINWKTKSIVKTGSIFVRSVPSGAEVFVDGKKRGVTPYLVKRVNPGKYSITVKKTDYTDWVKELEVEKDLVTEANYVLLMPANMASEILDLEKDLKVYSIDQISTETFFINNSLIWDFTDKKFSPLSLPIDAREIYWNTGNKNELSFLDNSGNVNFFNYSTSASSTPEFEQISSYSIGDNEIYYLNAEDKLIYKANLNGNNKTQISSYPIEENFFSAKIILSPNKKIAVLLDKKLLYLNEDNEWETLDENTKGAEWDTISKKILFWNDHEIFVRYFRNTQKGDKKELITRYAQNIGKVAWNKKDCQHIIFTVNGQLKTCEIDTRDGLNTLDIINNIDSDNFFIADEKYIYLLKTGKILRISLEKDA